MRLPPCLPALIVVALGAVTPPARTAWPDKPPEAIADVVAKVSAAVVRIVVVRRPAANTGDDKAQAADPQPETVIGSGFFIDPSGLVATNRHVVADAVAVFVGTPDGARYRAELVGMPAKADMALLRIHGPKPFPYLHFGDSDLVRVGDTAIAIGSPFGFDNSVTAGIVSSVNRNIMESPFDDYIQTDAAINHGNSGGPLFNLSGQVIGMTSVLFAPGKVSGSAGVGFAIPSNEMSFVFGRIEKYGEVRAGSLPLRTQQVTEMMAQAIGAPGPGGALVATLLAEAPRLNGQIEAGDIIERFNGRAVKDPRDLAREAARAAIGSTATLVLCRDGAMTTVEVPISPLEPSGRPDGGPYPPPRTIGLRFAAGTAAGQVVVAEIDPSGSAADSGLQKGDVLLRVEQRPVASPDEALAMLRGRVAADRRYAALLVERDGKRSWLPIALPQPVRIQ